MEPDFWHKKWEDNVIGFHKSEANHLLVNHFSLLALPKVGRVFVPLCGKTLDIHWLLENGHRVVGVGSVGCPRLANDRDFLEFRRGAADHHLVTIDSPGGALPRTGTHAGRPHAQ